MDGTTKKMVNGRFVSDGSIESLIAYAAANNMSLNISFYPQDKTQEPELYDIAKDSEPWEEEEAGNKECKNDCSGCSGEE